MDLRKYNKAKEGKESPVMTCELEVLRAAVRPRCCKAIRLPSSQAAVLVDCHIDWSRLRPAASLLRFYLSLLLGSARDT